MNVKCLFLGCAWEQTGRNCSLVTNRHPDQHDIYEKCGRCGTSRIEYLSLGSVSTPLCPTWPKERREHDDGAAFVKMMKWCPNCGIRSVDKDCLDKDCLVCGNETREAPLSGPSDGPDFIEEAVPVAPMTHRDYAFATYQKILLDAQSNAVKWIVTAIEEAVKMERERCARIAEKHRDDYKGHTNGCCSPADAAQGIASSIRKVV